VRRAATTLCVAGAALAAVPAPAFAHGLVGRTDLPIPDWLFTWGAAVVLLISFVALAMAWPRPKLQDHPWRPLPAALDRFLNSHVLEVACGLLGVALLAVTVWAGLAGTASITANFAPTFVYVAFWLGLVPLSVLFGDVFRVLSPWRAIGRAAGALFRRISSEPPAPLPYPSRLGYWPAVAGLLAFGWLELVSPRGDDPSTVATATLVYSAVTFVGMSLYGVEQWSARGETFAVYFGLFARLSAFERRDRLGLRPPLAGLPGWPVAPGAVALLAAMIGIVSFDGLSAGKPFNDAVGGLSDWLREDLGLGAPMALQVVFGAGMFAMTLLVAALYRLGVSGARTGERRYTTGEVARSFVHTLVPIALAYVAAHYVSLLLLQGQALGYLASDPLGEGWNLLGTASWSIDYGIVGAEAFWYLQVGFVVVGHVAALVLAHDRALAVFADARAAVHSQGWLLVVMVGFTTLALWLLAQARDG
jgi:hypothetical protein